ncbi:ParB/Srx family N-terminal domain-containing protein [Rhodococcus sp. G-MC3]|uniref:ParB/Srx family N-terminal domain-containing protein n=1 Tax=Rhodococcus sp. G-MC3 TaxID=3046209 RepID=UPI0024B9E790|nr:ParB/Srx family N-terminal domain-containing protein [Rhodococcus sp. G-MC3]MDJ0395019.1 ParB/Srx family N-terminal domain-containing protein [Rhodococcus sp. G-MC3]
MTSLRRAALLGTLALVTVTSASIGSVAAAAPARTASPLCQVADLLPTGSSAGLGYGCAEAGELLDLPIGAVRATQPSLGYDEVYYKLGRYTQGKDKINKKFDDWCEANGQVEAASALPDARLDKPSSFTCKVPVGQETPDSIAPMKTVVIGPGGVPYLTDGHHTLTSFFESADGGPNLHLRLRVVANLSDLSTADFWARMQAEKWVWNFDVDGKEVPVESLPAGVGLSKFQNDKYRSLTYFARDIGFAQGSIPFQEFYWGAWVRDSGAVDISGWDSNNLGSYLSTVESVSRAQVAAPKDAVINSGRTAAELGALDAWNDGKSATTGEFGKLSAPYSDDKPGKLAYALQYKLGLPR